VHRHSGHRIRSYPPQTLIFLKRKLINAEFRNSENGMSYCAVVKPELIAEGIGLVGE
jgi:hypothetical protein